MVTVVPPSGGPEVGRILVIVASGHPDGVVTNCAEQSSETRHMSSELPLHQPHSKPVPRLAPRHEEQPSASEGQLYRTTAKNKTCIYNTSSMNDTLARLYLPLTGVRRSMGWRPKDSIIHTILMVIFSLPVELLDEICTYSMCQYYHLAREPQPSSLLMALQVHTELPGFGSPYR